MRILFDECMPIRLLESPILAAHDVEHVTRCGFTGLSNGELHRFSCGRFDLLVTSDRHFRKRSELQPTRDMGIVYVRITPNVIEEIQPALEALFGTVDQTDIVGKLTVLWRDRWDIIGA